jgi:REP element-mobilizing transposase RayT
MVRGIERGAIVVDDQDREDFLFRVGKAAGQTGTTIYAWSLMSNHAHFLLKSGSAGLATFMRKILTGYAVAFNRRHGRYGHLFQNRYKSIICEEEPYFVKLVSYIHLNPLRANLVGSLEELAAYPWSGHAVIMGNVECEWQDRDYVLAAFGRTEKPSIQAYQEFVREQCKLGQQPELTGGGLLRSAGGWSEVLSMRQRGDRQYSDQRILGSGEFVEEILDEAEASVKDMIPVASRRADAVDALGLQCEAAGISSETLKAGCRRREYSNVRKQLAKLFILELGLTCADAARMLGISRAAVSKIISRS